MYALRYKRSIHVSDLVVAFKNQSFYYGISVFCPPLCNTTVFAFNISLKAFNESLQVVSLMMSNVPDEENPNFEKYVEMWKSSKDRTH